MVLHDGLGHDLCQLEILEHEGKVCEPLRYV